MKRKGPQKGKREGQRTLAEFPLSDDMYWRQTRAYLRKPERALLVSVENEKGGCAKTMTAAALGAYAAKILSTSRTLEGIYRVLYVDMDEQNSLSKMLGWKVKEEMEGTGTFLHWLLQNPPKIREEAKKNMIHAACVKNKGIEFALIPAGGPELLRAVQSRQAIEYKARNYEWFKDLINEFAYYFDLIIFDTGPSRNDLHKLVSSVVDEIIVPFDGLEAFEQIGDLIADLRAEGIGPDQANITLVMTKWQPQKRGTKLTSNLIYKKAIEVFPEFVCEHGVRETIAMKRSYSTPLMYRGFDPDGEYENVARDIFERWNGNSRSNFFECYTQERERLYKHAIEELREKEVQGGIRYAKKIQFKNPFSSEKGEKDE